MREQPWEYAHRDLEETVMAIGGHYRFTEELRMPFENEEVFYLLGYALFDSTCCGAGGCSYALVQGFVDQWKTRRSREGFALSRIRPVVDSAQRDRISRRIREAHPVQQVRFV